MPKKRAAAATGDLTTLVEELKVAEDDIVIELEKDAAKPKKVDTEEVEIKRAELIKLAEDKEIPQSAAAVKKASAKVVERIYGEWRTKCTERAASFLCDQFLSKFCYVLGGFDAIADPEEMEKELSADPLLRKDVESVMTMLTPWIPLLGVLSGGLTVGKHVYKHKGSKVADGFARGPFGGEKPPSDRTDDENKNGYDTVN